MSTYNARVWLAVAEGGRCTPEEVRRALPSITPKNIEVALSALHGSDMLNRYEDGRYGVTADCVIPRGLVTRCDRCKVRLIRPPIIWQELTLGPVCAVRLGYVPPAREIAGKVAKRARVKHSTATQDLFQEPGMTLEEFQAAGYRELREINGVLCGLCRFAFTTGLVVGLDDVGYERRYCYEHAADAALALQEWSGEGHPSGPWIKLKGRCVDILNPELRV